MHSSPRKKSSGCADFILSSDRLIFLATRVLVRQVLSRYESVAPDAWTFVANAHGRPEIAGPKSELRFNLSNTPGLVVCAVTREVDVGVDVEIARADETN